MYQWLGGEDAATGQASDARELAMDLARCVAALQRIDATGGPGPGAHNVFRGEPLGRRDAATRSAIAALRGSLDVEAVTGVWESALGAPAWERAPVWVHGDLDARNLLVDRGRLSAVIDWGCLGVGDPACDVAAAWKVLSAETRPVFRDALAVDDATWLGARGWALSQAVGALSYYTLDTNPTLVREARRWLSEALRGD